MPHQRYSAADYLTARSIKALSRTYSWNPVLTALTTDPNLGDDGQASGMFVLNGLMVTAWARFRLNGSGTSGGSGSLTLSPPIQPFEDFHVVSNTNDYANKVGVGQNLRFSNIPDSYVVGAQFRSSDLILQFVRSGTNSSLTGGGNVEDNNDAFSVVLSYVADPEALHAFTGVGG